MIREATKHPDHLIKRLMREIEDLEYVQVQRAPNGGSFRYRLLPQKKAPAVLDGLLVPSALAERWSDRNRPSGSDKAEQPEQNRKSAKIAS